MKTLDKICRIASVLFSAAAIVLFFFPFVNIAAGGAASDVSGAQLVFGSTVEIGSKSYNLASSAYYVFTGLLAVIALICAALGCFLKKQKNAVVGSFITSLISGVMMLIFALSAEHKYVDYRPVPTTNADLHYTAFVLIIAVLLIACAAVGIAAWLIYDQILVAESKGKRLSIPKKVVKFCRDTKAEIKKIIWPGPKEIVRNSVIVLVLCAVLGAFIWIVDYLLGLLLNIITSL